MKFKEKIHFIFFTHFLPLRMISCMWIKMLSAGIKAATAGQMPSPNWRMRCNGQGSRMLPVRVGRRQNLSGFLSPEALIYIDTVLKTESLSRTIRQTIVIRLFCWSKMFSYTVVLIPRMRLLIWGMIVFFLVPVRVFHLKDPFFRSEERRVVNECISVCNESFF